MNAAELGQAFRDGRQTFGTAVLSTSPAWIPAVKSAGIDFVFIDNEHTPMDREKVAWMCQAYRAAGIAPLVRIPTADPFWATMALDAGAAGIIAPYVETPEQIKALRGAVKYHPLKGHRLKEMLDGENPLSSHLGDYLSNYNLGNLLIVNIESTPAMDNLSELVNSPGLDAVFVGPHDLSVSLEVPEDYHNAKFQAAISQIINVCRQANIGVGIHLGRGDSIDHQIHWAKQGANILIHSTDLSLFISTLQGDIAKFCQATVHTRPDGSNNSRARQI